MLDGIREGGAHRVLRGALCALAAALLPFLSTSIERRPSVLSYVSDASLKGFAVLFGEHDSSLVDAALAVRNVRASGATTILGPAASGVG